MATPPEIIQTVQAVQPSIPPTTTYQEDIKTAGQRRVNLIWEATQAVISVAIVISVIVIAIQGKEPSTVLSNALFLVVGFYFSRTNHTKIGGVETGYVGRCIVLAFLIYMLYK